MIASGANATVELAKRVADVVPMPVRARHECPEAYAAWEDLMILAARSIAANAGHDVHVLRRAVGPAVEVGVNPAWRVLLMIALMFAERHETGRPRLSAVAG